MNAANELKKYNTIIKKAKLKGVGGLCAAAAIAINNDLFKSAGKLILVVNKTLNEWSQQNGCGPGSGHVIVEYLGNYFDSRGIIDEALAEDYAYASDSQFPEEFLDEVDLTEEQSYEFLHIPVTEELLHTYFDTGEWPDYEIVQKMVDKLKKSESMVNLKKNPYNWSIEQKSMGWTFNHPEIDYMGFIIWLTPDHFLRLCNELSGDSERTETITHADKQWAEGGMVSPPQLYMVRESDKSWRVVGHEGRHRATVALKNGCTKIPVFVYPQGIRGAEIDREIVESVKGLARCEHRAREKFLFLGLGTYWINGRFYRFGEPDSLPIKLRDILFLSSNVPAGKIYIDSGKKFCWDQTTCDFENNRNHYNKPALDQIGDVVSKTVVKNPPKQITSEDLIDELREIHHTPDDFEDGDIYDRISNHWIWVLKDLNINDIPEQPYEVGADHLVKIAKEMSSNISECPPIVYDTETEDVIDGNHRLNAAKKIGLRRISAWVPKQIQKNPPSPNFLHLGEGSAARAYKKDNLVEIITRPGEGGMYDISRDIVIDARSIIRDDLKKYLPIIKRKRIDTHIAFYGSRIAEFIYEMPFYETVREGADLPKTYTDYTKFGYKYPTKEQLKEIERVLNSVMADAYKKAGVKYDRRLAKFDGAYQDQDSLIYNPKFNLGWYQDGADKVIVFRDPLYAWMNAESVFKVYGSKFPEDRSGMFNNSTLSSGFLARYVKGCLV